MKLGKNSQVNYFKDVACRIYLVRIEDTKIILKKYVFMIKIIKEI